MKRAFIVCSVLALAGCAAEPTKEQSLVNHAAEALGGPPPGLNTVNVKGTVKQWEPEQSDVPGGEMRFANEANWAFTQDVQKRVSRYDWEKRFVYPAPRTFKYSEIVTPDSGYVLGVDSNGRNAQSQQMNPPAHAMSGLRLAATQREQRRGMVGPLVAAMRANPARVQPALDLQVGGRSYPAVGYEGFTVGFDPQSGLPTVVRTLDYDNVWGDVTYDLVLGDWRPVPGVGTLAFNRRYQLNGRTVQEVQFTDFRINQPIDAARFEAPAAIREGAAKAASGNVPYQWVIRRQFIGTYLDSENTSFDARAVPSLRLNELAPGVFHVVGGSHNSLLVEMADHLVMVDAPVSDAQSLWVVNTARQRFPGKPIRWLVLTHHHMDHAGGMRAILAEGAVLVVGQGAAPHYRKALAAPMTRNPDMKPMDFSQVAILEVPESHVISDSRGRQVIAYNMQDNPHAKGLLMVYVPDAKLGFVTDVWTPGPPLPDKANPALMSVVNTVKRAGIEPARFAGGHGGVADYAPLAKLAGQ
ncbi:MAG TPA: MBL fold metallo-hydrolase [Burkholderiales bacterium]|nr:MBL fold metallo-hydrolase [Burkholderiales bacterium]